MGDIKDKKYYRKHKGSVHELLMQKVVSPPYCNECCDKQYGHNTVDDSIDRSKNVDIKAGIDLELKLAQHHNCGKHDKRKNTDQPERLFIVAHQGRFGIGFNS